MADTNCTDAGFQWCNVACSPAGVATMYVRYKQLQALVDSDDTRLNRLNLLGFVLGCGSSLGMCVVANFQVRTCYAVQTNMNVRHENSVWMRFFCSEQYVNVNAMMKESLSYSSSKEKSANLIGFCRIDDMRTHCHNSCSFKLKFLSHWIFIPNLFITQNVRHENSVWFIAFELCSDQYIKKWRKIVFTFLLHF